MARGGRFARAFEKNLTRAKKKAGKDAQKKWRAMRRDALRERYGGKRPSNRRRKAIKAYINRKTGTLVLFDHFKGARIQDKGGVIRSSGEKLRVMFKKKLRQGESTYARNDTIFARKNTRNAKARVIGIFTDKVKIKKASTPAKETAEKMQREYTNDVARILSDLEMEV